MNGVGFTIRKATKQDAVALAKHRVSMFQELGANLASGEQARLQDSSQKYFEELIPSDQLHGWLVEKKNNVISSGLLLLRRLPPIPKALNGGQEAYVFNVFTEKEYRRQGFARLVMKAMVEWCRDNGISRLSLHASDNARSLYKSLDFIQTNEMRWEISDPAIRLSKLNPVD